MSLISTKELASLWYLRYGYDWVKWQDLPEELHEVADTLKRSSMLDYHMGLGKDGYFEVLKLKGESCRS